MKKAKLQFPFRTYFLPLEVAFNLKSSFGWDQSVTVCIVNHLGSMTPSHLTFLAFRLLQSKSFTLNLGDGQAVNVLAFKSANPSSKPAEVYNFSVKLLSKRTKRNKNRPGMVRLKSTLHSLLRIQRIMLTVWLTEILDSDNSKIRRLFTILTLCAASI